jgi:predicted amidohydrolase
MLRRSGWLVLTFMMLAGAVAAAGQTSVSAALARLPEGEAGVAAIYPCGPGSERDPKDRPPRKVVVGTVMQPFWGPYPGLRQRLELLAGIVDRMAQQAEKKYGRGLDLAVLPEVAVTGGRESSGGALAWSLPFDGPVKEAFSRQARRLHCYIVVPMYMREEGPVKQVSNVAILIDRSGEVAGIYRKLFLAVPAGSDSMEAGTTPGKTVPVFNCDFGRLGIQICFDMEYDYGWAELARQGAELVAWPSEAPNTSYPAFRSKQYHYYIVSSTWRDNAAIFEPTGKITSQVKWAKTMEEIKTGHLPPPEDNVLVQELDLSYAIVPFSRILKKGQALSEMYGDKVGYRYYDEEDRGIFWSNDAHITIGQMLRRLGVADEPDELRRLGKLYQKAGVPGCDR